MQTKNKIIVLEKLMRTLNLLTSLSLLITAPSLVYPQHLPQVTFQVHQVKNEARAPSLSLSYDEIMVLLDEIESGELEKKYSSAQLEKVNEFLALLATEGMLTGNPDTHLALQQDIDDLLKCNDHPYSYSFANGKFDGYMIAPAIFNNNYRDIVSCKSWMKKKWKKTKRFVKHHKKEIIIGAVIVVAVTVVIVAVVAISSTSAAAGVAAGAVGACPRSNKSGSKDSAPPPTDAPLLKEALKEEIASFKENLAKELFHEPLHEPASWRETGKLITPIFAHDSFNNLTDHLAVDTPLFQEIQNIRFENSTYTSTGTEIQPHLVHEEIDRQFYTDYSSLYEDAKSAPNMGFLTYQITGENALRENNFSLAIEDLTKAIELDPTNPLSYLDRGVAHFKLGDYENSMQDYENYILNTPTTYEFSIPQFTLGFVKGLPKGVGDSGKGLAHIVSETICHPITSAQQMWHSLNLLCSLIGTQEWEMIAETLVPEIHELVLKWENLPSEARGELAGHVLGKHGADIFIPRGAAKVLAKSAKAARALNQVQKSLRTAEQSILLGSAAGLKTPTKIAEAVAAQQKALAFSEASKINIVEMVKLKKAGKLEGGMKEAFENYISNSKSEILKALINEEKHVKLYLDYLNKPVKEIKKSIKSYEKQIALHQDKTVNPSKHIQEWHTLDPREQTALINKTLAQRDKSIQKTKNHSSIYFK